MNEHILSTKVQNFINEELKSDITKLILKGSPFLKISAQDLAVQIESKRKAEKKLPLWFLTDCIYYPPKISIEQSSSEITANYKSTLVKGNLIIDISGGFGVDAYHFSKHFKKVIHCEIDNNLSKIVSHNYKQLQTKNIKTFPVNGIEFLKKNNIFFDCIYIDPSRRNSKKGKVFLLKDCLPNIPENLNFLFDKSDVIFIKCSPILDIASALKELNCVKEVHVVAVQNEVKELLFLLKKGYNKAVEIKTVNIKKNNFQKFSFTFNSLLNTTCSVPKTYIYEPNSAILKSGGYNQVSSYFKISKLHKNSHLYTSDRLIKFPGRAFKILHIISYNRKELARFLPDRKANITVRNFPKSVEQIRKETKISDGGSIYIFCTTLLNNKHRLLICNKENY